MDNKNDTRQALLDEAAKMFLAEGYDAISINRLVKRCGVTKGAFYHYFKSKDELFSQVVVRIIKQFEEYFVKAVLPQEPFKVFLLAYFDYLAYFKNFSFEMDTKANLFYLIFDGLKRLPSLRSVIAGVYRDLFAAIAQKFKEAQDKGEVIGSIDPDNFAMGIAVLVEGLILFEVILADQNTITADRAESIAEEIWNRIKS